MMKTTHAPVTLAAMKRVVDQLRDNAFMVNSGMYTTPKGLDMRRGYRVQGGPANPSPSDPLGQRARLSYVPVWTRNGPCHYYGEYKIRHTKNAKKYIVGHKVHEDGVITTYRDVGTFERFEDAKAWVESTTTLENPL